MRNIIPFASGVDVDLRIFIKKFEQEWMPIFSDQNQFGYARIKLSFDDTGDAVEHEIILMDCRKLLWFNDITPALEVTPVWIGQLTSIEDVVLEFLTPVPFTADNARTCMSDANQMTGDV